MHSSRKEKETKNFGLVGHLVAKAKGKKDVQGEINIRFCYFLAIL